MSRPGLYGLLAEFPEPGQLVAAARRAREAGYRRLDGFSPYPIEELSEALGHHRSLLPRIVAAGAATGGTLGYLLQWWTSTVDYPLNIGGKPFHSWPAFMIVTFECTILFAALSAVLGMLALNRLPEPYHPVFNVARFEQASRNRFFLCIESSDPLFDRQATARFLSETGAAAVAEVSN